MVFFMVFFYSTLIFDILSLSACGETKPRFQFTLLYLFLGIRDALV